MDNAPAILVVDDDRGIRETLKTILANNGYTVDEAADGVEGLKRVNLKSPDLVILDQMMPKLDGIKVCRAIKEDRDLCNIPILMTSSKNRKEDIILGLESGANDYVVKPFDENELLARVQALLNSSRLIKEMEREKKDLLAILDISNSITSSLDSREVLFSIVQKISEIIKVSRCSIVRIDAHEPKGYVVASNEDARIYNLPIDLSKYPEVQKVLETRQVVVINDTQQDPIVESVRNKLEEIDVQALLVLPVIMKQNVIGTILLRTARRGRPFDSREIQFCQIVANASANALINAALYESVELANIQLEKLATTDGLTEIFNHRYFYKRLDEEFNRSQRYNNPLSAIMIDVDNFKEINDTYGHRTGDLVLKELARNLKNSMRKSDIVARYGGDEFIILLPQTDSAGARAEAARVIRRISDSAFGSMNGSRILISCGIATAPHDEIKKADDLVLVADRDLYANKAVRKKSLTAAEK
ncbi:MAG: diguanylate cyclase [bacterium]|nr:diguanylate cyclase [bacterium]